MHKVETSLLTRPYAKSHKYNYPLNAYAIYGWPCDIVNCSTVAV